MRKFNVSFSDELYSDLKKESEKIGITMTALITVSVHEYLKQNRLKDFTELVQLVNFKQEELEKMKDTTSP